MSVNGAVAGPLQQMQTAVAQAGDAGGDQKTAATDGASFAEALTHSIDRIDALKQAAAAAGKAYESGAPGIGLNEVMVDMAKADVATTMGIQIRNRVVNAYKDVMNMQV